MKKTRKKTAYSKERALKRPKRKKGLIKLSRLKNSKIKIVPFNKSYENDVRSIAWVTAFLGQSGKKIIDDKKLMTDFLCNYYLQYEADKIFIALENKKVVGYLFGCIDEKKYEKTLNKKIIPDIVMQLLKKKYKFGIKTLHFLFGGLIWSALFEGKIKIPKDCPAHLHMNLKESYRRKGIGTLLIKHYLKFLFKKKIKGVHLITTSHHKSANPFYNKLGFKLYNKKPTKMWSDAIKETVYFRIYKLRVNKENIKKIDKILKQYKLTNQK